MSDHKTVYLIETRRKRYVGAALRFAKLDKNYADGWNVLYEGDDLIWFDLEFAEERKLSLETYGNGNYEYRVAQYARVTHV